MSDNGFVISVGGDLGCTPGRVGEIVKVAIGEYNLAHVYAIEGDTIIKLKEADLVDKVVERILRDGDGCEVDPVRLSACVASTATESDNGDGDVDVATLVAKLRRLSPPGEIWVTSEVYEQLPIVSRLRYGDPESVCDNAHYIRRRQVLDRDPACKMSPPKLNNRYVVCIDLARSTRIIDRVKRFGLRDGMSWLQNQLRDDFFGAAFESAFRGSNMKFDSAKLNWEGDGAKLMFRSPEDAHDFAFAILKIAEKWNNRERLDHVDYRCFRVGIAMSDLEPTKEGWTGDAMHRSERLQSAFADKEMKLGRCGEIRLHDEVYRSLSPERQALYGGLQRLFVPSKTHESGLYGHRCCVGKQEPWTESPPAPECAEQKPLKPCFLIGPNDELTALFSVLLERVIEPACRKAGFKVELFRDIIGGGGNGKSLADLISLRIAGDPLVIAYLGQATPEWNPNLMIEIGYRLGISKPLVLLSHKPAREQARSIADVLPFHLKVRQIVELPNDRSLIEDQAVLLTERLRKEILEESTLEHKRAGGGTWFKGNIPHPMTEVKKTDEDKDKAAELEFTAVSTEARALFGESISEGASVDQLIKALADRMSPEQHRAFMQEQADLLHKLQTGRVVDPATLRPRPTRFSDLVATIPIVFDEANGEASKAYLPIVIRYMQERDADYLAVLYLDVTNQIVQEGDHWACRL